MIVRTETIWSTFCLSSVRWRGKHGKYVSFPDFPTTFPSLLSYVPRLSGNICLPRGGNQLVSDTTLNLSFQSFEEKKYCENWQKISESFLSIHEFLINFQNDSISFFDFFSKATQNTAINNKNHIFFVSLYGTNLLISVLQKIFSYIFPSWDATKEKQSIRIMKSLGIVHILWKFRIHFWRTFALNLFGELKI